MVYIQVGSGGGVNYQPLCAMGILPILICIFIKYRQEELFRLRSRQFLTENDSTNCSLALPPWDQCGWRWRTP